MPALRKIVVAQKERLRRLALPLCITSGHRRLTEGVQVSVQQPRPKGTHLRRTSLRDRSRALDFLAQNFFAHGAFRHAFETTGRKGVPCFP